MARFGRGKVGELSSKSRLSFSCFTAGFLRSFSAAAFSLSACANCSTFSALTLNLSGAHQILVTSSNHVSRYLERVGELTFAGKITSDRHRARLDQACKLVRNLLRERFWTFAIDTYSRFHSADLLWFKLCNWGNRILSRQDRSVNITILKVQC
jgi:hypothetical protein